MRKLSYMSLKLVFGCLLLSLLVLHSSPGSNAHFQVEKECFCKPVVGINDDIDGKMSSSSDGGCECSLHSVDVFNNEQFYKVNMEKPCPFWPDDRQCSSKECTIGYCDDEVPPAFHQTSTMSDQDGHITEECLRKRNRSKYVDVEKQGCKQEKEACESSNRFDPLDRTLSEGDKAQLRDMDTFEEEEYNFCDIDDETSADMHYVNLLKNPERYTGYKGDSAVKVWQSIYQENCFKPNPKFDKDFILNPTPTGLCLEKRVFYRLISGLHTAITVSIASNNYKPAPAGFGEGTWFRNYEMFKGRFGTKWFGKEGPERLKNLYFAYMLELRALVKVAPYMQKGLFYTGNDQEDAETRQSVDAFMALIKTYPEHFDETQLFTGYDAHARSLREDSASIS
uniref:Uncharacterized protein n=1 Tax=Ditylenchus dipsaci TaxID=166011 RepID=A0A915EK22_9BILA